MIINQEESHHDQSGKALMFQIQGKVQNPFPSIVFPLYDTKDSITFSTWLEIEWIANSAYRVRAI